MTATRLRLLCMTAHPDDESGAFGGALLQAHQQGVETTLVCLTDGQAAHFRGGTEQDSELGQRRRAELDAACKVLGITRHEVLDYPDGQIAYQIKFYELVGMVVARIRRWRPQIVLTFGTDGGVNLHRDHIMVSLATNAAFHWAGRPEFFPEQIGVAFDGERLAPYTPQKLYLSSTPFVSVRARPELSDSPTTPWSLALDLGDLAQIKLDAFMQHTSQHGVLDRLGGQIYERMKQERYLLVASRGIHPITSDTGLLDGLQED